MSRVWGRVAFLRYPVQENSWALEPNQHRARPGTCNTPGVLKHLMAVQAPKSHLCLQSAKATGAAGSPSSALAQPGHSWRGGIGTATTLTCCSPPFQELGYVCDWKQENPKKIIINNNNNKKNPERTFCSYMSKLNLLNGRKAICRSSNLHCIFIYHSHYT